jgi:hypothetical protein
MAGSNNIFAISHILLINGLGSSGEVSLQGMILVILMGFVVNVWWGGEPVDAHLVLCFAGWLSEFTARHAILCGPM